MSSANNLAFTVLINTPGETPLSRDQVWAGLLLKIRSAEIFVPGTISKTNVISESIDPDTRNAVTVREVVFRETGQPKRETVTVFEPARVEFIYSGGNISNIISKGGNRELYLIYNFEQKHPRASKEKLVEFFIKEKGKGMAQSAVEGTIRSIC